MGKSIRSATPAVLISVAALAAFASHVSVIPQVQAQGLKALDSDGRDALCPRGNATLHGTYMSKGGGTVVGVGPVAFIGTVRFDGKGGVTNPFTLSLAGAISRLVGQATYTVKSDCSGTFTTTDDTQHYDIRVSPDGSGLDFIETDAGTVISGSASRVND